MSTTEFFNNLWNNYVQVTPQAKSIYQLFLDSNSEVINDHVAFRTFSDTPLDIAHLEPIILQLGYSVQSNYIFEEKKLEATSYIHSDSNVPKIFISELKRGKLSASTQDLLNKYCNQIATPIYQESIFWSGTHWNLPTSVEYSALLKESEYAAWLLIMGLRANHFTVSVNDLASTDSLEEVLVKVETNGFTINMSGGRVKGSKNVLLEQGSTIADKRLLTFSDGVKLSVSSCFYEFAKRYEDNSGLLFSGFVTNNANKIFESTNVVSNK